MSMTWVEDNASRSATIVRFGRKAQSTYVKSWKLFGSSNDAIVHADVDSRLWAQYLWWDHPAGVRFQAESYSLEYLGDDAWQLQVTYVKGGADDPQQPEQAVFKRARSFDTTGGTQHITQAAGERAYGTGVPAMGGAIGVDEDTVQGVDIVVPALQWSESYEVPSGYVSNGYMRILADLTGSVNTGSFRGFQAGEVLFMGASGSQEWHSDRGDGPWSLSYKFVASPNATGLAVGTITGIEKKGHEYLWVRYESSVDNNTLFKKPRHVYVNKVYRDGNFDLLGIS